MRVEGFKVPSTDTDADADADTDTDIDTHAQHFCTQRRSRV